MRNHITNDTGKKKEVIKDPSHFHESRTNTQADVAYRIGLEDYFRSSIGSNVEKLENFTKYVPRQVLTTFISKYEIFKRVLNIQGSIVECGVLLGGGLMTFAQLSAILEPLNFNRKIIGFDTFSGFTGLYEEDKTGKSEFAHKGGFCIDSYDDLTKCVELYDANRPLGHMSKISLVKGDVKTTIPNYLECNPQTVVSLLYLDMDVFEPTKVALEHIAPRIPKGGIIAFDELNEERWPGETIAVAQTIGIRNLRIERLTFDPSISFAVVE